MEVRGRSDTRLFVTGRRTIHSFLVGSHFFCESEFSFPVQDQGDGSAT